MRRRYPSSINFTQRQLKITLSFVMRCLALVTVLSGVATAWVGAPPARPQTLQLAKKRLREGKGGKKGSRLQEMREVSGASMDATEQWAANLEQRLDAVAADGPRDEKAQKVLDLCSEENRDFEAIDAAVAELATLPAVASPAVASQGDWRLVWAKSDEGVGFVGTGLHRVPLANLEEQFLSLKADRSCALTEVIRVLGPFPNVKNLLTGTAFIGPGSLALKYTKVIDGTGAELTSSQARSVRLRLAALSARLLVVAAASADGDDWLVFEREDDFEGALKALRVTSNIVVEEEGGGLQLPKMPWAKGN